MVNRYVCRFALYVRFAVSSWDSTFQPYIHG